jgi:hypothetical protein
MQNSSIQWAGSVAVGVPLYTKETCGGNALNP